MAVVIYVTETECKRSLFTPEHTLLSEAEPDLTLKRMWPHSQARSIRIDKVVKKVFAASSLHLKSIVCPFTSFSCCNHSSFASPVQPWYILTSS